MSDDAPKYDPDFIPRDEYITAMAAMRDRAQTLENMLSHERNAKRAALRRAEAAEKLNHTLVEKLRTLDTNG